MKTTALLIAMLLIALVCIPVAPQVGSRARPEPAANTNSAPRRTAPARRSSPARGGRPPATGTNRNAAASAEDAATNERTFWESIRNSSDPEDFRAYLEQYPNGRFASLARNRLRQLEGEARTNRPPNRPPNSQPGPNANEILLAAILETNLDTAGAQQGDRFSLTVRRPQQFEGASIEGSVARVERAGRVSGRGEIELTLEIIRLRDGRTYNLNGVIERVRTLQGETLTVVNPTNDQRSDNRREIGRREIGSATSATIGAIAGGGQGAAIGAPEGARTAGSTIAAPTGDLRLERGAELSIKAAAPQQ